MNNQRKPLIAARPNKTVNHNYNEAKIDNLTIQFGVSKTFARLMLKYECKTPDDYRKIRNKRKKERTKKK